MSKPRKPAVFSADDPAIRVSAPPEQDPEAELHAPEPAPKRGWRWGALLLSALGGLVVLALTSWATQTVSALFVRGGWLGWLALGLAILAGFSALMLLIAEIAGLMRLGRVTRLRAKAESALAAAEDAAEPERRRLKTVRGVVSGLERLLDDRSDTAWQLRRFREHRGDVIAPRGIMVLAERELLQPLDQRASAMIAASARRVSVITAISPSALVDVGFAAYENLRLMRRLATLYGGRPGFLGLMRLARMVIAHLAVTGGVAMGDDVVQQVVGHGLTARLSARLGEGIVNGAFTARIGIATLSQCRPLPYIEAPPPRLRALIADLIRRERRAARTEPSNAG
ncbi:YcjF family protein [Dichotomicrobium thermohalophilum]|uniref:Putative membrane protein n=1 Tax=Dichotomicrobium thermohalophilum TaxID=933063 RepID=A0A397PDN8_9HYPH|nr:TIGR01620 family protein [Dichotomicrobium thermohalophilum]RIA47616.1 putative membrane protein [Dichotomicrobium thermohalophilum]